MTLTIDQVSVGDNFKSARPVFRGDDIEFRKGFNFEVVSITDGVIRLKSETEGQHTFAETVTAPDGADDDCFFIVDVSIDVLNHQFEQV